MRRRDVIGLLGGAVVAWPLKARAQQPRKIPRLCFLTFDPGTVLSTRFEAFFQGLRELGYVDGQSITVDYLSAEGRGERYQALAAECLRLKADIVVVSTTEGAQVAKNTIRTVPIVMITTGDPVGTGLVASLTQPGGNITGMSLMTTETTVKRLELLREAVPGISRVLVLTYLNDPIAPLQVKALTEAAGRLAMTLQIHDIRKPDDLAAAFDAGASERAEGLLATGESIFVVNGARVSELAARHKLPAIYHSRLIVDAGGLMAYGANTANLYRRAATYIDKILKGASPANLPVEQPTKFDLVINLKTARALGLDLPPTLLGRADEVIE
jgi:putative ABC transport system substrate-binding protein